MLFHFLRTLRECQQFEEVALEGRGVLQQPLDLGKDSLPLPIEFGGERAEVGEGVGH